MNIKSAILIAILFATSAYALTEVADDYKLTDKVTTEAQKGWDLFKQKKFVSEFDGGKYTDPDESTLGYAFWSNGKIAKYDRDANGHYETIFVIREQTLVYVGSIGSKGTFVDVSSEFSKLLNKYMPGNLK